LFYRCLQTNPGEQNMCGSGSESLTLVFTVAELHVCVVKLRDGVFTAFS
jgi:hypothetical protein